MEYKARQAKTEDEAIYNAVMGEHTFKCSKCDQEVSFGQMGMSQLVLPRLYPEKMGFRMRREALDYKLSQFEFTQKGMTISGLITIEERDHRIELARKHVAELHATELATRHWWSDLDYRDRFSILNIAFGSISYVAVWVLRDTSIIHRIVAVVLGTVYMAYGLFRLVKTHGWGKKK